MKNKLSFLILFLIPIFALSQQWELKTNKNGVKIYVRNVPDKNFKEFKGVVSIKAPLNSIFNYVKNAGNAPLWVDGVSYAKILKSSGNEYYSYEQIDMPTPFQKRDLVVKNTIKRLNDREIKIILRSVPDYYPQNNDFIRIQETYGFWLFKQTDDKTTEVVYQIYSDPAGNLPAWLVNKFITTKPYQTLLNLKNHFEK